MIEEEETSRQTRINDVASTKAKVLCDDTRGEGVEQATFLSCRETMAKDKADDSRTMNATSREDECLQTRIVFETLGSDRLSVIDNSYVTTSLIEACVIENGCVAYTIDEVAANDEVKEVGVKNTIRVDNNHGETFSTFVPEAETWVIVSKSQRETQESEGGGEEAKVKVDTCDEEGIIIKSCSIKKVSGYEAHEFEEIVVENDIEAKMVNGHEETFPTLVLETWH